MGNENEKMSVNPALSASSCLASLIGAVVAKRPAGIWTGKLKGYGVSRR
jgi:hypothetical protein